MACGDGLSPAHPDSESRRPSSTLSLAVSISEPAHRGSGGTTASHLILRGGGSQDPGQLWLKHPEGPGKSCHPNGIQKELSGKDLNPQNRSGRSPGAPRGPMQWATRTRGSPWSSGTMAPPSQHFLFSHLPVTMLPREPRTNPNTIGSFLSFSRTVCTFLFPHKHHGPLTLSHMCVRLQVTSKEISPRQGQRVSAAHGLCPAWPAPA